jgi:hypothetical protein
LAVASAAGGGGAAAMAGVMATQITGPKAIASVQDAVKRMARRVGMVPPSCVSTIFDGSIYCS